MIFNTRASEYDYTHSRTPTHAYIEGCVFHRGAIDRRTDKTGDRGGTVGSILDFLMSFRLYTEIYNIFITTPRRE